LSADVAGGHDAAAATIAEDITRSYPDAVVRVDNGLRMAGYLLHHVVRDGYRLQITYASPTYAMLFRLMSVPLVARAICFFLRLLWGRRLCRAVRAFNPDVVVSTYPLVTALLGEHRRRGDVPVPLAAVVTDADPHLLWLAPGVDSHLLAVPGDVARVAGCQDKVAVVAARPPVRQAFLGAPNRAAARSLFALPHDRTIALVSGGGWGVGNIEEVVEHLVATSDLYVLVTCGSNERLRQNVSRRYREGRVRALPFCDDMPGLFAASDVLIQTGAGLTCLEAIVHGLPVILCNVLPGHGVRSAAALEEEGMVCWARTHAELTAAVATYHRASAAVRARRHAEALRRLPPISETIGALSKLPRRARSKRPLYLQKRAVLMAGLVALAAWRMPVQHAYPALGGAAQAVRQVMARAGENEKQVQCLPAGSSGRTMPWRERGC